MRFATVSVRHLVFRRSTEDERRGRYRRGLRVDSSELFDNCDNILESKNIAVKACINL